MPFQITFLLSYIGKVTFGFGYLRVKIILKYNFLLSLKFKYDASLKRESFLIKGNIFQKLLTFTCSWQSVVVPDSHCERPWFDSQHLGGNMLDVAILFQVTVDTLWSLTFSQFASPQTPAEERYNGSHGRTRSVIEHTSGILKSRFRCLHHSGGTLMYVPEKCAKITVACTLLHNYCVQRRIPLAELLEDNHGNIPHQHPPEERLNHDGHRVRREVVEIAFM